MAIKTGLGSQAAIASESTWGTGVVVTRFLPHIDAKMTNATARLESKGIINGRRTLDSLQSAEGGKKFTGQHQMELYDHGQGLWWSHMMGGAAISGAGPYTQTYTPGDLSGKSFTYQYGYPDIAGTANAFTYAGTKVSKWTLTCQAGQIATVTCDLTAKSETTATALATAAYTATLNPLTYVQGAVTGMNANVKAITLTGDNKLDMGREFLNVQTIGEQLEQELREYTGTATLEFNSLTDYARYTTFSTTSAVVLTFTSGSNTLTITMNARFDGDSPVMKGRGIIEQPLKFKCVGTTDAAAITVVTVNSDSAA